MRSFFPWAIVVAICLIGCSENYRYARTLCIEWYNRGLNNLSNPEYEFKNAIKADPKFAPPYYWLAYHFCRVERTEESIEYFEKYLQVVDRDDPQEIQRLKTAECFVKEMRSGNVDYNSIVEASMKKE
jgi:hypothetical protein